MKTLLMEVYFKDATRHKSLSEFDPALIFEAYVFMIVKGKFIRLKIR